MASTRSRGDGGLLYWGLKVLAGAAGAAVVGAAAWAAKNFYKSSDAAPGPPAERAWHESEESSDEETRERAKERLPRSNTSSPYKKPSPKQGKMDKKTLLHKLRRYHDNLAEIPQNEIDMAKEVTQIIATAIRDFIKTKKPELPLGDLYADGHVYDGMKVIRADQTTIMAPMSLDVNMWELVPGEETVLCVPGWCLIRRQNVDYFPMGTSGWDHFVIGGYLSPRVVMKMFIRMVQENIDWPSLSHCFGFQVRPKMRGLTAALDVFYGSDLQHRVQISLTPAVRFENLELVARPHPATLQAARPDGVESYQNLWRESFMEAERIKLETLEDELGCHRVCLKVVKAVTETNSELRALRYEHLLHLLFHLCDKETRWEPDHLVDRYEDMLQYLQGALAQGALLHYFDESVNLFADLPAETLQTMHKVISLAVTHPATLLQR
ncbi:MIEF1 [Branchiostoma lanceolatum]|uniref:MIEF1 protein n=1 Tax=Branchiostoma lanceolatum TaxID=7740 RepID=A0A8K0ADF4_BRALA|nr:MIEF1 [Branchiostoma lanceolatum]